MSELEDEVHVLHGLVAVSPSNLQLRASLSAKLLTLKHFAHDRARQNFAQAGAHWASQGDFPSAFFFKKAKCRRERAFIGHIKDPAGVVLTNHSHISERFTSVYRELYTAKPATPESDRAQSDLLNLTNSHVFSVAELRMLNELPSPLEILDCLKGMKTDIFPGPDGLSSTFFVKCWSVVGSDLISFIHDAWTNHYLSARVRMVAIIPIPKSLALDLVENWRLISLLNVIYKLIAKLIAVRLGLLIGMVVLPQQGGFIRGRGTFPNILHAQLAFAWAAKSRFQGLVVKIDSHKAYDRVSHSFLLKLIVKMGVGSQLVHLVEMLYCSAPSHLLINGSRSDSFTIGRGVCQGCPLAPLLYALSTQPLMASLHHRFNLGLLEGWPVPPGNSAAAPFFMLFADDLIIFLPNSIRVWWNMIAALQHFGLGSGNLINRDKTQVKSSCNDPLPLWLNDFPCTKLQTREPLIYLGVPLGASVTARDFLYIWIKRANSMLSGWDASLMNMAGRAVLVRHCLNAIPEYLSSCGFPPLFLTAAFTSILRTFFWSKNSNGQPRLAQIVWSTLSLPKGAGGLGFRRSLINFAAGGYGAGTE
ncbi:unnamed protein product [Calypogeia fissa]